MNKRVYKQLKTLKGVLQEKHGINKFALIGSQAREDFTKDLIYV